MYSLWGEYPPSPWDSHLSHGLVACHIGLPTVLCGMFRLAVPHVFEAMGCPHHPKVP